MWTILARIYREAVERPEVVALAVGTRPDCVPDPVLDLIAERARARVVWIEYGLQSIHNRTLDLINRGHTAEAFFDAVRRTHERGILTVAHLILGFAGRIRERYDTNSRICCRRRRAWRKAASPLHHQRHCAGEHVSKRRIRCRDRGRSHRRTLAVLEALPRETVIHRLTSDPHPQELVAPTWMLDRTGVRNRLNKAMEERDFRQGTLRGRR